MSTTDCQWVNCNLACASSKELFNHVVKEHIGRGSAARLTCGWEGCADMKSGKIFGKRDNAISHARKHIKYFPHPCTHCNKKFRRPQDLKKHMTTAHCDIPGVGGSNGNGLNVHDWGLHEVAEWLFRCGLGDLSQIFIENKIFGPFLLKLNHEILCKIGVQSYGQREMVLNNIAWLNSNSGSPNINRNQERISTSRTMGDLGNPVSHGISMSRSFDGGLNTAATGNMFFSGNNLSSNSMLTTTRVTSLGDNQIMGGSSEHVFPTRKRSFALSDTEGDHFEDPMDFMLSTEGKRSRINLDAIGNLSWDSNAMHDRLSGMHRDEIDRVVRNVVSTVDDLSQDVRNFPQNHRKSLPNHNVTPGLFPPQNNMPHRNSFDNSSLQHSPNVNMHMGMTSPVYSSSNSLSVPTGGLTNRNRSLSVGSDISIYTTPSPSLDTASPGSIMEHSSYETSMTPSHSQDTEMHTLGSPMLSPQYRTNSLTNLDTQVKLEPGNNTNLSNMGNLSNSSSNIAIDLNGLNPPMGPAKRSPSIGSLSSQISNGESNQYNMSNMWSDMYGAEAVQPKSELMQMPPTEVMLLGVGDLGDQYRQPNSPPTYQQQPSPMSHSEPNSPPPQSPINHLTQQNLQTLNNSNSMGSFDNLSNNTTINFTKSFRPVGVENSLDRLYGQSPSLKTTVRSHKKALERSLSQQQRDAALERAKKEFAKENSVLNVCEPVRFEGAVKAKTVEYELVVAVEEIDSNSVDSLAEEMSSVKISGEEKELKEKQGLKPEVVIQGEEQKNENAITKEQIKKIQALVNLVQGMQVLSQYTSSQVEAC